MHYSLQLLVNGRPEIVGYYQKARDRWLQIWSEVEPTSLERLAKRLRSEQPWFENSCGGRWLGQEIMVVSGLAGLYTTEAGFDRNLERARLLYDAFQCSLCSVEVKSSAQEVARSYDLFATSDL